MESLGQTGPTLPITGALFPLGAAAVRCGAMGGRAHDRVNCSCAATEPAATEPATSTARPSATLCSSRARLGSVAEHVSAAYRLLPQPPRADPSVKCCRNKASEGGPIDRNRTLHFTKLGVAAWPEACEARCAALPRCRYFSHSMIWRNCILCADCDEPEVPIGDGSDGGESVKEWLLQRWVKQVHLIPSSQCWKTESPMHLPRCRTPSLPLLS